MTRYFVRTRESIQGRPSYFAHDLHFWARYDPCCEAYRITQGEGTIALVEERDLAKELAAIEAFYG